MKTLQRTLVMFMMLFTSASFAQLYTYSLDELGAYGSIDANVTATGFSRVNGTTSSASCPEGFQSRDYSTSATWTTSSTAIQWTITPNAGVTMTVTGITFDLRRNNNGPEKMKFAYSTDGGLTWTSGSDLALTDHTNCFESFNFNWDFADFATTSAVMFRIYGWDANNSSGIGGIRTGTVSGITCTVPTVPIYPAVAEVFNCRGTSVVFSTDPSLACSYQWYKNDNPLAGATSTSYSTTKGAAHYNVQVTTPGGCSAMSPYVLLTTELNPNANIYSPNGTNLCNPDPGGVILLKADYNPDYTYQWLKDGSPYAGAGATEWRIFPTETGSYRCHVWSPGLSCDRYTPVKVVVNECRLMDETASTEIAVYPNPASGSFMIEMNTGIISNSAEIAIYNVAGEIVFMENAEVNNGSISHLANVNVPNGIYYVRINIGGSVFNTNILIQN